MSKSETDDKILLPLALEPFRGRLEATVKPYVQLQTQICEQLELLLINWVIN